MEFRKFAYGCTDANASYSLSLSSISVERAIFITFPKVRTAAHRRRPQRLYNSIPQFLPKVPSKICKALTARKNRFQFFPFVLYLFLNVQRSVSHGIHHIER